MRGNGHLDTKLQVLASILYIGLQEYDWAINGLVTRAKSTLAASAIVLGVMIAGIGGLAWLLNAGELSSVVMMNLRETQAIVVVLLLGMFGLASMLGSACLSAWALRAVKIRSPFSSNLITMESALNEGAIQAWVTAPESEMYKIIFKAYAAALKNREDVIGSIGPKTLVGQALLVMGLLLTTVATMIMLVAVNSAIGA